MAEGPSQPWGWRRIVPVLAPVPIFVWVFWYLINHRNGDMHRMLFAPGMLAFPCMLAFKTSGAVMYFTAALFWYLGAAAVLQAALVPRKQGKRWLLRIFVVFAALVGLMLWWFSKWNVD